LRCKPLLRHRFAAYLTGVADKSKRTADQAAEPSKTDGIRERTDTMLPIRNVLDRYIVKPLAEWRERQVSIAELRGLDDHLLADIGIRRGELTGIVAGTIRPNAANENCPNRAA
jgi:uncharacterized protein YjiS (DUF1127 family)